MEYQTPPELLPRLGKFDLDPCATIENPTWVGATNYFTKREDGLKQMWHGRVYCNPPYGKALGAWLERCADHGNAIALIFARTETEAFFHHVWKRAHGILFLEGRLHFYSTDGDRMRQNSGAPSVLIAYGARNAAKLLTLDNDFAAKSGKGIGKFVKLRKR